MSILEERTTYTYDGLGQLLQLHSADTGIRIHHYDTVGNRLSQTQTTATHDEPEREEYHYAPASNRLLGTSDKTLLLDPAGNILQESNDTQRDYRYNAHNRISEYYEEGQLKARYHYNSLGQRIHKAVAQADGKEQHTLFHYGQQGELLGETRLQDTNKNSHTQNIVWLQMRPVVALDSTTSATNSQTATHIAWLHSDHLLTARAATDADQNLIWRWHSDAFGVGEAQSLARAGQHKLTLNLRLPGQYYDEESGLHYNYFRTYDPQQGRYTQSDPIGLDGGLNTYGYAIGKPVSIIDYFGTDAIHIRYEDYPINVGSNPFTGEPIYIKAYHAAVVTVDPATGGTRYYEYGRYDEANRGIVRRATVPDLAMQEGSPTEDSLLELYSYLSVNLGRNTEITAVYHKDSNHLKVIEYAEKVMHDPNRTEYSLYNNNCGTFADAAVLAGKE